VAVVGSWTLGAASAQSLVAASAAIPGRTVTFSATALATQFDIEVRFIGAGGTAVVRQAFLNAANKWRRMILGDLHTVTLNRGAGDCAAWVPAVSETINDVVIFARIGPIDGAGSILARAGPCIITPLFPVTGIMEFDEADLTAVLNNNTFEDIVLHEMGHVLGVGTLWDVQRTLLSGAGSAAPFFTGAGARAAFTLINTVTFGGDAVPVEGNARPVGTRDSHWRESVFGRELMQGFAKVGGMPLSRVTVASMQDLGYIVNLAAADPFSITSPILAGFPDATLSGATLPLLDDLIRPQFRVDAAGRVQRLVRE
jgi:CBS domain-containing protein